MISKNSLVRFALLALVIVAMLGLPVAAGAQAATGFTSPKDGATVSGTVEVTANAGGPNFSKWQLDLLPGGNANAPIFLAVGTAPGAVTYTLDTTKWPEGQHALRLRNVRADSNYDESVVKFTIANKAAPAKAAAPAAAAAVASTAAVTATKTTTATATAAVKPAPVAAAPVAAPVNGFSSPKAGSTIKGTVPVTATATGPNFSKWQLDLLPGGNSNAATFLAVGTTPGTVSYSFDTTIWPDGQHALRLRNVRADSNYDEYTDPITITNKVATAAAAATTAAKGMSSTAPVTATKTTTTTTTAAVKPAPVAAAPVAAPVFGISSPKADSTIKGTVPVTGTVDGPNFSKWQLDLLPGGNSNAAIFLAVGTTPGTVSYSFDTTKWPDGKHALRLRSVRADSNYDEYTTPITITNSLPAKAATGAATTTR